MERNMATKQSLSKEGIDPPAIRHVRAKNQIGLDAAGREHYWDGYRQCVWVVAGDDIVHRQPLGGDAIQSWVDHIERERDWETLFWSPGSVFDRLAEIFGH